MGAMAGQGVRQAGSAVGVAQPGCTNKPAGRLTALPAAGAGILHCTCHPRCTWQVMAAWCPTVSVGRVPVGSPLKFHTVFLSPPAGKAGLQPMAKADRGQVL